MKKHLIMLAIASSCFVATHASAMTDAEHKVAKEKVEADYKVGKAQCDAMKDNAKDVCEKEAKGKQNVAKAELEQQFKPSDSRSRKVAEEKVKAKYEVAKEKCDDMKETPRTPARRKPRLKKPAARQT